MSGVMRRRDDRGSAIVELVWLGILLLVPLLWIVVAVFEVQGGAFAVSSAARSAGRAFALAPDDGSGHRAADAAARQALDDQGLDGVAVAVEVTCTPYPANCHSGTSVINVRVSSRVVLRSRCRPRGSRLLFSALLLDSLLLLLISSPIQNK